MSFVVGSLLVAAILAIILLLLITRYGLLHSIITACIALQTCCVLSKSIAKIALVYWTGNWNKVFRRMCQQSLKRF